MISNSTLANTIRILAIDAIEKSQSGHPGLPLGMADVCTLLFKEFLRFNPQDPEWLNRDRFILSAGHGSMLLYSLLHLTGYKLTIDDLKSFRQYGSKTPGHPEYRHTAGVETTTGPLGQGLVNGVGIALGEAILRERFNQIIDHKTYVLAGDGCLMEGISQEAISLAGHLNLKNLIVLFDSNEITIDGKVDLACSENIDQRFKGCGWQVIQIDGHDFIQIKKALTEVQTATQPTIIVCRTIIGYGAPNKSGSEKVHGSPLGQEEAKLTRENLRWEHPVFEIPHSIQEAWRKIGEHSLEEYRSWQRRMEQHPQKELLDQFRNQTLPSSVQTQLNQLKRKWSQLDQSLATRKSSHLVLQEIVDQLPNLIGGSADLTGSNLTKTDGQEIIQRNSFKGHYLHYGIREHAMAGVMNGLALYGFKPYGGTFLVFSDYARPAIRLAALMELPVIYVLTHDSIGLGEDGPTHQPVEHLSTLRAIPNLNVFRPCDGIETAEVWQMVLQEKNTPSVLALSRQGVPLMRKEERTSTGEENLSSHGGYILWSSHPQHSDADLTLIASGSEVHLAYQIALELAQTDRRINLVSMPCLDIFKKKSQDDQDNIIAPQSRKVVLEAGIRMSWDFLLNSDDHFFGVDHFGLSAPHQEIYQHFGLTKKEIVNQLIKSF